MQKSRKTLVCLYNAGKFYTREMFCLVQQKEIKIDIIPF